ncbi:MAG: caspase family protein [Methyloceanibacter sp.]
MRTLPVCFRLIALLFTLTLAQAQAPEPRTALVVGNADYSFGALDNPINDAKAVAKSLEEAGFAVTLETDADQAEMQKAIAAFGDALKQKGGVGLFYFAGHGVQISGENYLLPVGMRIKGEDDIKTGAVTATEIVDTMASSRDGLNIVVFDACRNNPLNKGKTRGLSRIDSNESLFVSYSTSPGAVALDGEGANSPYTKYLAASIATPHLNIEETFKRTLKGVYVETKGEQIPWISSTFFGDFVFRPNSSASTTPDASAPSAGNGTQQEALLRPVPIPQQAPIARLELAGIYRVSGTNPNGSQYHGMVALSQTGDQFSLTWWIGKQVFHGTGHFAGKMLVVNWGDKHPVIYTFGDGGALDGEWADGSATEQLFPVASAAAEAVPLQGGTYKAEGHNPNGTSYEGTVTITKHGKIYQLTWNVGSTSYKGSGTLKDNLLTVNWGSSTPVVYALAEDGSLSGLWDAGRGEETLTPEQ